jgi:hypothetical protein
VLYKPFDYVELEELIVRLRAERASAST